MIYRILLKFSQNDFQTVFFSDMVAGRGGAILERFRQEVSFLEVGHVKIGKQLVHIEAVGVIALDLPSLAVRNYVDPTSQSLDSIFLFDVYLWRQVVRPEPLR